MKEKVLRWKQEARDLDALLAQLDSQRVSYRVMKNGHGEVQAVGLNTLHPGSRWSDLVITRDGQVL